VVVFLRPISNNFGKGRGMTSCFRPRPNSILSVCALAAAVFVVVLIFDEDIPNLLFVANDGCDGDVV